MIARLLLLIVIFTWALASREQLGHMLGLDTRSDCEREVDKWAHPRAVASRACFDQHPRADGRARCSVQFADSLIAHTIWCAPGDGCRWF